MKNRFVLNALAIAATMSMALASCGPDDTDDTPTDPSETLTIKDDGNGVGTVTWGSNDTYLIDGFVFVNSGQTLTIEPGCVIKGKAGQGDQASALIVARGGKVIAEGTATNPIVFTAEADNLNGNLSVTDRGLWGGLIILGNAKLNSTPGISQIEGLPTNEPRGSYGGTNDADNSGVYKYISVRHGGTDIGDGNEINGITLGGVGSGTVIDYVEVIANKDDGIEFFGGNPNVKHALVSNCGDDCFDYDEGFKGNGQFWVAIQDANDGDRMGEHDGGTDPETAMPYAIPTIYNATYIGRGAGAGKRVMTFRDNAGGHYANSIFANQDKGIDIEKLSSAQHSFKQFQDGNLSLKNNVFQSVANGTASGIFALSGDGADSASTAQFVASFDDNGNETSNPGVSSSNPVPSTAVTGNLAPVPGAWFEAVSYKGAFGAQNWAKGWTKTFK
jgi:hypothetical protein